MPQHKRGPWSQTEDNYLLSLVNLHGAHNWVRISQAIQTRSPKQCRERFHQNLKPTLNHEPITPEEGVMIEQMVAEMGKRWAEIARRLRGRSDNAVKNWWNGGMNRRRRSHNPRRTTLEFRAPQAMPSPAHLVPQPPQQQQPLPGNFPPPMAVPQQFFNMPGHMFHHPGVHGMPQPIRVPPPGHAFRAPGLIETPLPSPSAYSQMSAEGAPPSLISDSSSISGRSPHNGPSPIELPPLSGSRSERRQSTAPMLQLGVPGSFVQETDYQQALHLQRYGEADKQNARGHGLQEPFMPAPQHHQQHPHQHQQQHQHQQHNQAFLAPAQYVPHPQAHHRGHPMPMPRGAPLPQQYILPQQQHPHQPMQRPPPPQHLLPSQPVQLPGISTLPSAAAGEDADAAADAAARQTPVPGGAPSSPDGSPKHKMSLSNLTH